MTICKIWLVVYQWFVTTAAVYIISEMSPRDVCRWIGVWCCCIMPWLSQLICCVCCVGTTWSTDSLFMWAHGRFVAIDQNSSSEVKSGVKLLHFFWNEWLQLCPEGGVCERVPGCCCWLGIHRKTSGWLGEIGGGGGVGWERIWAHGSIDCSTQPGLTCWSPSEVHCWPSLLHVPSIPIGVRVDLGWDGSLDGREESLESLCGLFLTGLLSFPLFILRARLFWNQTFGNKEMDSFDIFYLRH